MFMDSSSIKKTHAHMLSKSHTVQSVSADPSHTHLTMAIFMTPGEHSSS